MATFGDRLHELRTAYKLSFYQLADILGLTEVSVWQWEQNLNYPRAKNIKKLCDYFNVSIDYLLGYSDRKNPIEEISTNIKYKHPKNISSSVIVNTNVEEKKSNFLENCIYLDKVLSDDDKNLLLSVAKYMMAKAKK